MYKSVVKVKPLSDYILLLIFDNNEVREFDVTPYLDLGIFSELRDLSVFNSVKISFDTVEWINGADLDPEVLYEESISSTRQFSA